MSKIAVNQFAILRDGFPQEEITLNTELSFKYSHHTHQVACEVRYDFVAGGSIMMLLKCQCDFVIYPDDWAKFCHKDNIAIPKDVLELFAVHTIGASRGILYCKTEGTPFNGVMIPPINVSMMMKDESNVIEADMR